MKVNTQNLPKCETCQIKASALFGELADKQLNIARELRSCQTMYPAGDHLYFEGDVPDKAYTVYNGWVILYKSLKNGRRQILKFALPGDFLCYKVGKRTAMDHSAIAVTDVTLCTFPLSRFAQVISVLPDLSFAISSISEANAQRCHGILTTIASHAAETKVAYLLLSLYLKEHATARHLNYIPFPITQEDIGDTVGLTSVHVNRVIQSLRKKELIECGQHRLCVPNTEALAKVAQINLQELERLVLGI